MKLKLLTLLVFLMGGQLSSAPYEEGSSELDAVPEYHVADDTVDVCSTECDQESQCCHVAECCEVWGDPFRIYADHVEGKWLDNQDGYSSIGIFLALPSLESCNIFPFLDLRFHVFNHGETAGNFGGGLRYIDRKNARVFGVNAYYDYRETDWRRNFDQVGLGFEVLTSCFDVRLNSYWRLGDFRHSKTHVFDNFIGGFIATCERRQSGTWGGDLELGRWLVNRCPCDFFDLYGAIGAYYYNAEGHDNQIVGAEVRLASNLGRYVNLELKGGYDEVYRGSLQGRITLTFPLSDIGNLFNCCLDSCCIREIAYQPVQRQEIIVLGKKDCCWTWNWDGGVN